MSDPHIEGRRFMDWLASEWRKQGMNPGNVWMAQTALDQALLGAFEAKADWREVLNVMRRTWPDWLAYWAHEGTERRYRPTITTWIVGGYWREAPAILEQPSRKAEAKESAAARALRLMREAQ